MPHFVEPKVPSEKAYRWFVERYGEQGHDRFLKKFENVEVVQERDHDGNIVDTKVIKSKPKKAQKNEEPQE